ncbi:MAG: DUF3987 domain-containing protein [Ignavibacteria bacterium]|nr:DUF3987 domain-containing protein [Ignavibacteria bacterium]
MQNSAYNQEENEHFHSLDNWKVNRENAFPQLIYTRKDGTSHHYSKDDKGIPLDIYNHFWGKRETTSETDEPKDGLLDAAVEIPLDVYALLPNTHRELCELFSDIHEKHVFLCGMLPTIASVLPNVEGAHADGFYSPDIFLAVVAGAGQGKGKAAEAKGLAEAVDGLLRNQSEAARLDYEAREKALGKGESMTEPPPPEECHIVPANASAIALIQSLHDNGGRAYLFETEIDSLLAADRNADWGNVSSILRGAFHHETVSVKRKTAYRGKTTLTINCPRLSVFLSGTPSQFTELMQSTENGLFSRFGVYFHNPPLKWRSHAPTKQSRGRKDAIKTQAEVLKSLYKALTGRNEAFPPVLVELSDYQWALIDLAFSDMQNDFYNEEQRPDLLPSARRGAIVAFRLAMQFAVIRWKDTHGLEAFKGLCKEENAEIEATNDDVECGIALGKLFTNHAHSLSSLLPRTTKAVSGMKPSVMRFLELLPKAFDTNEAIDIAVKNNIAKRTAERYIKSLTNSGNIKQIVQGKYIIPPNTANGGSGGSGGKVKTELPPVPPVPPTAKSGVKELADVGGRNEERGKVSAKAEAVKAAIAADPKAAVLKMMQEQAVIPNFADEAPPDYENSIYNF